MRAAYITELGPAHGIRHGELPEPAPGPADVLVEVECTTVNPVDTFVRSGRFRTPVPLPLIVGRDVVGTVLAAGPGAPGFRPGDRVWTNSLGHGGRQGAAAERAVVPADRLYPLPTGADPERTAAVLHPGATAWLALFSSARLRPGETVFVAGAAGNVGSALVTLAVDAGARVLATASAADAGYVRELGAEAVFDYREAETGQWRGRIDVHVDSFGVNDLSRAVESLAPRGRIVLLAGAGARPVLPVGPFYQKDASILGFVISHATTGQLAEAAVTVNRLTAAGKLKPRRVEVIGLGDMADAHLRMEKGELRGRRLVVRPGLER